MSDTGRGGHHVHVLGQELHVALMNVLRGYRLDDGRLVVGVLHGRDAEEDMPRLHHLVRDLDHEVADAFDAVAVQGERLLVFTQADGGHLHQAALYAGAEVRVGFDPVDEHHTVGLRGDPVHVHGHPVLRLPDLDDLHGGTYRGTAKFFRHAQGLQDLDLPLCRGPAVAAHRRHYEGLRLHLLQDLDEGAQNLIYLCDAAAARGERHAHAWLDCLMRSPHAPTVPVEPPRSSRRAAWGNFCLILTTFGNSTSNSSLLAPARVRARSRAASRLVWSACRDRRCRRRCRGRRWCGRRAGRW